MSEFKYDVMVAAEPVGFLVYIKEDGVNLTLANFCSSSGFDVLGLMKVLTTCSGFKPEPADAIGFFLFEAAANKFIESIKAAL